MNAKIVNIGDELLIGQVVNTNASYIAQQLNLHGIEVKEIEVVGDNENQIIETLEKGQKYDLVIITGGLGPTKDDITKHTLAKYTNDVLVENNAVLKDIETLLKARGRSMNHLNKLQALVPSKSKIIRNFLGTAPGMIMKKNRTIYISLPGVPYEMKPMLEECISILTQETVLKKIIHKTVYVFGIPESELSIKLEKWENALQSKNIKLAYLPNRNLIRLRLSMYNTNSDDAEREIMTCIEDLKTIIGRFYLGEEPFPNTDDNALAKLLVKTLKEKKLTISFAESCTGGSIASSITKVAGASEVFLGSIVSYSNNIKKNLLEVNEETLQKHGAVSKECVEEMVIGLKSLMKTDIALSVSGIAGPTGGTPEKPVGTVWMSLYFKDNIETKLFQFGNQSREYIIESAVFNALAWIMKKLIDE